jgi:hypothetical protein
MYSYVGSRHIFINILHSSHFQRSGTDKHTQGVSLHGTQETLTDLDIPGAVAGSTISQAHLGYKSRTIHKIFMRNSHKSASPGNDGRTPPVPWGLIRQTLIRTSIILMYRGSHTILCEIYSRDLVTIIQEAERL